MMDIKLATATISPAQFIRYKEIEEILLFARPTVEKFIRDKNVRIECEIYIVGNHSGTFIDIIPTDDSEKFACGELTYGHPYLFYQQFFKKVREMYDEITPTASTVDHDEAAASGSSTIVDTPEK